MRGTAQNPDVFFQAREAANPFHDAVPGHRGRGDRRVGRAHRTPLRAGRLLTALPTRSGSSCSWARPPARWRRRSTTLVAAGEQVGMLQVRLFQPFPTERSSPRCRRRSGRSPCSIARRNPARSASRSTCRCSRRWPRRDGQRGGTPPFDERAAGDRRPLRPVVEGGHAGDAEAGLRRAGRTAAEAALHRRHLRRRHPPEPGRSTTAFTRPPLRRRGRRPCSSASDPTAPSAPTRASVKIIGEHTDLLRAGLLRLRLEEVGLGDRVAPALRARSRFAPRT